MKRQTVHLNTSRRMAFARFACGMDTDMRVSTRYVNKVTCGRCKQTVDYRYLAQIRDTGRVHD